MNCEHRLIKRDMQGGWFCEDCLRSFFPSGETGAEQETVRLRTELTALQTEFEHVRQERIQADALIGELRDELTAANLERDALRGAIEAHRKAIDCPLESVGNPADERLWSVLEEVKP